jgi:two-component system response regulator DesR
MTSRTGYLRVFAAWFSVVPRNYPHRGQWGALDRRGRMGDAHSFPALGERGQPNGDMLATVHGQRPSRSCSYLMISRHRGPRNLAASAIAADDDYTSTSQSPSDQPTAVINCPAQRSAQKPDVNSIRVLLVIEMSLLRGALATVLASEEDIEVVGGIAGGDRVVPIATRYRPDIIVLDIDQGGSETLAAAQLLRERLPECQVVVLASAQRPGLVRRALDVPVAGALDKDAQPKRLLATIRQVAKGKRTIDPALAVAAIGVAGSPLTPRELTVLDLASGGASPTEIAQRLFLSRGTVCNYLSRVMTKLEARTRIDAIRIAAEAGWI